MGIDFVGMGKRTYRDLKNEARLGLRENSGMLFGKYEDGYVLVTGFERFPVEWAIEYGKSRPLWKKILTFPYGIKIASERADYLVSQRDNVVGFYHNHPNSGGLSPADKRDITDCENFKHLYRPSMLHILCRRKGFTGLFGKAKPFAFIKSKNGIKEVPIKIPSDE